MSDSQKGFVWYELMTTDTEGAKAFYGKVVGWGTQEMPELSYTLFTAEGAPASGLMALPEDARRMGAPPCWLGYVGVEDVDATVERVRRLGGHVHASPRDIPNVGRFAVVADPQAASFALFTPATPGAQQPAAPAGEGRIGWHELSAADWPQAFDFYSELFGWQKAEAMDMGEMGVYQIFSVGGQPIGGMMNKPPMVPAPFWLYYFRVGGIDAAAERARGAGGEILLGPIEVPGGDWIIQGRDPQGAVFALVGKRG